MKKWRKTGRKSILHQRNKKKKSLRSRKKTKRQSGRRSLRRK